MSAIYLRINCVVCMLLFAAPPAVNSAHADTSVQPLSVTRMGVKLRELLKAEGVSRDTQKHASAVIELCEFCVTMRTDSRYANSQTLQGFAARGRRRLIDVRRRTQLQLKKDEIEKPANFDNNLEKLEKLLDHPPEDPLTSGSHESPPAKTQRDPNGGRAPGPDNGWMLIELINRAIHPDFWSDRGGPGVIHYYRMQRVLVIRATTTVHEDVAALLKALGGLPR